MERITWKKVGVYFIYILTISYFIFKFQRTSIMFIFAGITCISFGLGIYIYAFTSLSIDEKKARWLEISGIITVVIY